MSAPRCVECGRRWFNRRERWRSYLTDDGEPVTYCQDCAETAFGDIRLPLPLDEAAEIRRGSEGLASVGEDLGRVGSLASEAIRGIRRDYAWYEMQLAQERRWNKRLREQLRLERARAFPFTDADVLDALHRAYVGEPVSATDVVAYLFPGKPLHSSLIRTGRALARVAAAGAVVRVPGPDRTRSPHRWQPVGGSDA